MGNLGIILIITIVVVGIFVVGMSLTLMIKGHHIKSEISDNERMRREGIRCAVQEVRDEEKALRGADYCPPSLSCSGSDCSDCSLPNAG